MQESDFLTKPWPEDLFDFAWFPDREDRLNELANLAENEDWTYQHTPNDHPHPILFNFIRYTYRRLAEENKIALSENGQFSCFNTSLVTPNQEAILASFEVNRREDAQPWFFKGWFRRGEWELTKFQELPDLAHYFDDPSCLVFDHRVDFRINIEHILSETPRERFPEPYQSMDAYALQTVIKGAIDNAKERVRRSYKTAIPQYYRGRVQMLLPLCLSDPQRADLALVVERHANFYRASTCLTLDMAYNNARQLAKPDRDWLQP
jgi:Domain of unknown function (DUF3825)